VRRIWHWRNLTATLNGRPIRGPTLLRHLRMWHAGQPSEGLAVEAVDAGPEVPLRDPRQVCWDDWPGPLLDPCPRHVGPVGEGRVPVVLVLPESMADELRCRAVEHGLSVPELVMRLVRALEARETAADEATERASGE
jgi:hypothetical protein